MFLNEDGVLVDPNLILTVQLLHCALSSAAKKAAGSETVAEDVQSVSNLGRHITYAVGAPT